MSQKNTFFEGEGKAWLGRNRNKLTTDSDPVIEAIDKYKINPGVVLEVGCANGWRLKLLKEKYKSSIHGIDPHPSWGKLGTADSLYHWDDNTFDTIIYGWCLYLCDPEDYFKIAYEGDRLLHDNGFIIVYDFNAHSTYKTKYKHKEGLFSHHYEFSKLWTSHPAYSLYGRTIQEETSVTIIKKNLEKAFPER